MYLLMVLAGVVGVFYGAAKRGLLGKAETSANDWPAILKFFLALQFMLFAVTLGQGSEEEWKISQQLIFGFISVGALKFGELFVQAAVDLIEWVRENSR